MKSIFYLKWIVLMHNVKYPLLQLPAKFNENLLTVFKVIAKKYLAYLSVDTV